MERMNITFVPGGNMVVLSSSISAKVSKMSCHECKGYKWQCPTTQSPTQQHNELQRKFWVDQVTPPPPPPGERQGVGNGKGGGGVQPPSGDLQAIQKCDFQAFLVAYMWLAGVFLWGLFHRVKSW